MSSDIKVSVIIPVYNVEKYLEECLNSVVNQTLREIEVILVDDGSTDGSLKILRTYAQKDSRIILIEQENGGAGTARNAGLAVARGEYLSFLDSDDKFEAEMLKRAYMRSKEMNADICAFRCDMFDAEGGGVMPGDWALRKEFLPSREVFTFHDLPDRLFFTFIGWAWDKLFRRAFVLENGLYFQALRTTNDMYFVFSALVCAERIVTLNEVLAHQRRHVADSLSVTREKSWHCFLEALSGLEAFLKVRGIYDELERGFINYALHFSLWNLNSLTGTAYKKLFCELQDEYFTRWRIGARSAGYFFSSGEYGQALRMIDAPFDEYVVDSMQAYRRDYLKLKAQLKENGVLPADEANEQLLAIQNSLSYKIGRATTFLPRLAARFVKRKGGS